jgi:hypothetical protein
VTLGRPVHLAGLAVLEPALAALREVVAAPAPQVAEVLDGRGSVLHIASKYRGRALYAVFAPGQPWPALVLKSDAYAVNQARLEREHAALRHLEDNPALAGTVPRPVGLVRCGGTGRAGRLVLAQTGLPGTQVSVLLRRRRSGSVRVSARHHALMCHWFARLSAGASAEMAPDPDAVAAALAAALPGEAPWRRVLSAAQRAAGDVPPRVPSFMGHGDLGPSNYLVHRGSLAVIDWEGWVPRSNAVAELVLFLSHYARAVPGGGERLQTQAVAFERAFVGDDWLGRLSRRTFAAQLQQWGIAAPAGDYLLLAALAQLATGGSTAAHGERPYFQRAWADLLARYVAARAAGS